MGIEPTSEAWEALSKTLKAIDLAAFSFPSDGLNWKLDGNQKRLLIEAALRWIHTVRAQPIERVLVVPLGGRPVPHTGPTPCRTIWLRHVVSI
jgi:hypothetical protein